MSDLNALVAPVRDEGVPILGYYNLATQPPWRSVLSPVPTGLRCGPGGVSIGRYGWADVDGFVRNVRTAETDIPGLVLNQGGDWRRVFWDELTATWKIREGFEVTLLTYCRTVTVRLANGGRQRAPIYANPLDGALCAEYAAGLEATPWTLTEASAAGALAYITTWNKSG